MADWVRDKALLSMTSPLAADALIPTHMIATEEISHPFNYEIAAVSQVGIIPKDDLLNKPVCVILRGDTGPARYFHGIVHGLTPNGVVRGKNTGEEFQNYSLTVVPRLWTLRQTLDCRVYQNKSVKDILTAMFQDAGLTDFTFSVSSSASRPYTVQFNESDYHFALRLMEEEGWFYYFEHTETKHTIIITDKNATFKDIPDATLHFSLSEIDTSGIMEWRPPVHTTTGSYAKGDYDPEKPGTKLYNQQKTVLTAAGPDTRDIYRWPALTNTSSIVEGRAKFEIEAAEAAVSLYHGSSHFGALVPGGKFTLTNNPAGADDGTYALRAVTHLVEDSTWITNEGNLSYSNRFEAIQAALPWRQPLATPRPRMEGVHSALVMGPQSDAKVAIKMQDGEEIHTDDLARVKVRFFWDWRAEATGGASLWARVIQPWAGNGWGTQFIPRVGTEVAVAFVDGDPDRPIVLGGLYNGASAPIYAVADKTKSGIRTRSSLKGDSSKFNELTFDDKKDNELIFIHAQKDMTTEVEHDEKLTVDNCRIVLVKVDETIDVKGKQTITIVKDHSFEVTEGNSTNKITKGNHTFEVSKGDHSSTISMGNSKMEVSKGNHDVKIGMGNFTTKVGMGNVSTEVSMGNSELKLPLGNVSVKADLGKIDNEAMQAIEFKVGASSIKIDQMGVTIKGMMISIEGQIQTQVKGLMTQVSGDVMLQLKGAITMIG